MTSFKWLACFVLRCNHGSRALAQNPLPGECRKCTPPSCKRLPDDCGRSRQPFRPLPFLLDTGTQITVIDPSLAAELHLDTRGAAVVASAGSRQSAS